MKVDFRSTSSPQPTRLIGLLTRHGILTSLLEFQVEFNYSRSAQKKLNSAVKLLLTFMEHSPIAYYRPVELLRAFKQALDHGTIDENMDDPTGLYWPPRSYEVISIVLRNLTRYSDWLALQDAHSAVVLNPIREATTAEQRIHWCAYHHRQNKRLLNHLERPGETQKIKFSREVRNPTISFIDSDVVRFPKDRFNELMTSGFIRATVRSEDPRETTDYKAQCMTLLMDGGGLRESELFHIYLDDIKYDTVTMRSIVRVFHPSQGKAPEHGYTNREDYLRRKYRLQPRTNYLSNQALYAGWKNPAINKKGKFLEVQFYPESKAIEFSLAYQSYLLYQRKNSAHHPFAFTNSTGAPETIQNFSRLQRAAVERIGLIYRKDRGTTEHGHRHAYAFRCAEEGDFTQKELQFALHHRHPDSCLVYIQYRDGDLRAKMKKIPTRYVEDDLYDEL
ncbi:MULTISPECIES: gamma-mobile-trio recombinase GmtY [Pseudomonas]|uniref:Site-specific integrase n=1 Tax=Pseudomonas quercus TaxID=2722792 RepID=A0ABX0YFA7_9PSED|nr:gamma-mobile-trio recombinase GmtY [Pseudomonas sp. LY10J]MBF7143288.1 site-specific integrase [Pseudomonas sp. LY10J]NJP01592.1 site-specific integrase [Pseudomonas quercus]